MVSLFLVLFSAIELSLSEDNLQQGQVCYVKLVTDEQGLLSLTYRGEPYPLIPYKNYYISAIGTSYKTSCGRKAIKVYFSNSKRKLVIDTAIIVRPRKFRKSVIKLSSSKQSAIDTSRQRRKKEEYKEVVAAINAPSIDFYSIYPEILPCRKNISGTYGDERWANGKKLWNHSGLDFAVPKWTPILAPCVAKVIMARDTFIRQGNFVMLDHGAGLKTLYYHMVKRNVEEGDVVVTGDTLGFVGSTGLSTGPHLHMSVYIHGIPVDPLYWLEKKEKP